MEISDSDLSLSDGDAAEIQALFEDKKADGDELMEVEPLSASEPESVQAKVSPIPSQFKQDTHEAEAIEANPKPTAPANPIPKAAANSTVAKSQPLEQTTVVNIDVVKSEQSLPDLSELVYQSTGSSIGGANSVGAGIVAGAEGDLNAEVIPEQANSPAATESQPEVNEIEDAVPSGDTRVGSKFKKKKGSKLKDMLFVGIACLLALGFAISVGSFVIAYLINSKGDTTKKPRPNRSRVILPGQEGSLDVELNSTDADTANDQ